MIRYMDRNGCSAKFRECVYSCNHCSVLTEKFDSIIAPVAVHATMIIDMLVQSYLVL